ncbi:SDR family oxidoreductase [Aestuariicella hydrocarbonica]|uniref:SDR family oxidoreductase n=1 Tax=Pseudomaricurvus hydrocarbonicus TaxID=1470433 RepID=A0A9E5JUN4_9GAMM|nr:SDR family NAD(P)-dependent oxidoreductase [Aestuariicella hydrocarbonica]NHO66884.1 SDR family oxidoreductase [Aestuariicella hydrocarbonica]
MTKPISPPEGDLFDLSGQVALVTGAAGGLGREIAQTLAHYGAEVVVSDLSAAGTEQLAEALNEGGYSALPLIADLADAASVIALAEQALAWRGRVNTLVCCGGMEGYVGSLLDVSDQDWQTLMTVNLQSAQRLSAALAPNMRKRGGGSIVFIASIAGLRGNRSIGLYGIAKAGLAQLARNLAVELGPDGIRVNALAPGLIDTPLSKHLQADEAFMLHRMAMTPLRRVGKPSEIAGVVTMLAGRAGGFMTGQTLVVDGGTVITDGS